MPRPIKGSDEAKSKMSHLRSLRKNKSTKEVVESKSEQPTTESSKEENVDEIVGTGKKTNSWIRHVKNFAKTHNINYFEALKHANIREGYKK